jgi:hypothetical protein
MDKTEFLFKWEENQIAIATNHNKWLFHLLEEKSEQKERLYTDIENELNALLQTHTELKQIASELGITFKEVNHSILE